MGARKKLIAGKPNLKIQDRITRKDTVDQERIKKGLKKESTKDSVVCFGCKETGHVKRDCPKGQGGQVCYNCQKIGHISANCPERRQEKVAAWEKQKERVE